MNSNRRLLNAQKELREHEFELLTPAKEEYKKHTQQAEQHAIQITEWLSKSQRMAVQLDYAAGQATIVCYIKIPFILSQTAKNIVKIETGYEFVGKERSGDEEERQEEPYCIFERKTAL